MTCALPGTIPAAVRARARRAGGTMEETAADDDSFQASTSHRHDR
jgi:hypothetical protein